MIKWNVNIVLIKLLLIIVTFVIYFEIVLCKPKLDINSIQSLHFGTFCLIGTSGGTITVGYDGNRTCSGGIVLLSNLPHCQPAIVEIINCKDWHLVILFDAYTNLLGSFGGWIKLDIGPSEKGGSGTRINTDGNCDIATPIRLGGTLHIPGTAKSGVYDGYFEIKIKKE